MYYVIVYDALNSTAFFQSLLIINRKIYRERETMSQEENENSLKSCKRYEAFARKRTNQKQTTEVRIYHEERSKELSITSIPSISPLAYINIFSIRDSLSRLPKRKTLKESGNIHDFPE